MAELVHAGCGAHLSLSLKRTAKAVQNFQRQRPLPECVCHNDSRRCNQCAISVQSVCSRSAITVPQRLEALQWVCNGCSSGATCGRAVLVQY